MAEIETIGKQVYEMAAYVIGRYREMDREAELGPDVEMLVQASIEEVRRETQDIAKEVFNSEEQVHALQQYLSQVPTVARHSLMRPEDPSGTSVGGSINLLDPLQLSSLLLNALPCDGASDKRPKDAKESAQGHQTLDTSGTQINPKTEDPNESLMEKYEYLRSWRKRKHFIELLLEENPGEVIQSKKLTPEEMVSIGNLYPYGLGVAQDYVEATNWYRKAADLDSTIAMKYIASLYQDSSSGTNDYVEAMNWYRKAASLGDTSAMVHIGNLYRSGHGMNKDYVEAMNWYRKAASLGLNQAKMFGLFA